MLNSLEFNLVNELFKGMVDKANKPYLNHLVVVANKVKEYGGDYVKVGLLHDSIEDIDFVNVDWLLAKGVEKHIVEAVVAISKVDNEPYENYIKRVKENELARIVKIADMEHNSDLSRLEEVDINDLERVKKYKKAIEFLKEN